MNQYDVIEDLIKIRLSRGLSQTTVARRMGVSPARISHFESGYRTPNLRSILRYASAVGAEFWVERYDSPHRRQL